MAYTVHGALPEELSAVREIIVSAWEDPEDEPALWDYIASSHPGFRPEAVRVATVEGKPVACTVVLPCRFRTPRGLLPGAEITLVACRPEWRRRGLAGATFTDAIQYMAGRGLALAVFRGDPAFYGRFGCAPVLPAYRTAIGLDRFAARSSETAAELRPVAESDLRSVAALYRWSLSGYHLATSRAAEPWLWRVRNPRLHALLAAGDLSSYAFVSEGADGKTLIVREAAIKRGLAAPALPATAQAAAAWRRLLRGLGREAERRGLDRLELRLPPDNPMVRLAIGWGAGQTFGPPEHGLGIVSLWEAFLPPGWQLVRGAAQPGAISGLALEGRPVLKVGQVVLEQMLLGYRSIDDILLAGHAELVGEGSLEQLRTDFPWGLTSHFEAPFYYWL